MRMKSKAMESKVQGKIVFYLHSSQYLIREKKKAYTEL